MAAETCSIPRLMVSVWVTCVVFISLQAIFIFLTSEVRRDDTEHRVAKRHMRGGSSRLNPRGLHAVTAAHLVEDENKLSIFRTVSHKLAKDFAHRNANADSTHRSKDKCANYTRDAEASRTFQTDIWGCRACDVTLDDVTLITQMAQNKIPILSRILDSWTGPLSVALYMDMAETDKVVQSIRRFPNILHRKNVHLHLVVQSGEYYPINFLRNLALNNTRTRYVFLADVDFLPSYGIHDYLLSLLRNHALRDKEVFVVPAFEYSSDKDASIFPENKTHLLQMFTKKQIKVFHWKFKYGHASTNYTHWKTAKQPYQVAFHDAYEPYIVMRRSQAPAYDQRFVGRFGNKIFHIRTLYHMGFGFVVLPDAFIIHHPHQSGKSGQSFRCSTQVMHQVKRELAHRFPMTKETKCPKCVSKEKTTKDFKNNTHIIGNYKKTGH